MMIVRIVSLLLTSCFLFGIWVFAQAPIYKSKEIYAFCLQIQESAKNQIWNEFDLRSYTQLKTEAGNSFINFTIPPDDQFFWRVNDEYFQRNSLEDGINITFHEAFHAFERDPKRKGMKWGAENAMLIFEYQESSARNNALFSIESRIIQSALLSKRTNDVKKKVRQFLTVRKQRQSEMDSRFVEFEKGAELNEGLAEYVGTRSVVIAMEAQKRNELSLSFAATNADSYLRTKYEKLNSISKIGRNIRLKFYYTGSAEGLLLDRLMPDWKVKVQMEGKALQDLLEASVVNMPAEKKVEAILRQYEYDNVLAEEEKFVAQRKADNQALLDRTLGEKGRKFIIDYSSLSKSSGVRGFDPMNVSMITPKVRVHTRTVNFVSDGAFTANFTQPVVEDLEKKRYTTVVPENEKSTITIDGENLDSTQSIEKRFNKSLVIIAPKFKLEAGPGAIKITNDGVHITLLDKN
jgi:hypothetical protein